MSRIPGNNTLKPTQLTRQGVSQIIKGIGRMVTLQLLSIKDFRGNRQNIAAQFKCSDGLQYVTAVLSKQVVDKMRQDEYELILEENAIWVVDARD